MEKSFLINFYNGLGVESVQKGVKHGSEVGKIDVFLPCTVQALEVGKNGHFSTKLGLTLNQ
jgi:hypothetical protein